MPKVNITITTRELSFLSNLVLNRLGYLMTQDPESPVLKELEVLYRELSSHRKDYRKKDRQKA